MNKKTLTLLALFACMSLYAQNEKQGGESHEYVDLGLPSGTLWATCNVGANSPEEYGDYFAWGETEPKETYDWSSFKWCDGSENTMTKYGTIDNKTKLDPEDDAAIANWGNDWCMPTNEQLWELTKNSYTDTEWTTMNDVNGYKITSKKNGNSIFIPAAGVHKNGSLNFAGSHGFYWSCDADYSKHSDYSTRALLLYIYSGYISASNNFSRFYGQSVRPVRRKKTSTTTSIDGIIANKDAVNNGKYISNGNFVIVMDGKQYNANGIRK